MVAAIHKKDGHIYEETLPTSILLDSQERFEAFGYKAEEKYAELLDDKTHKDWHFVKHFPKALHKKEGFRRSTMIPDETGTLVSGKLLMKLTIEYLKDLVFENLSNSSLFAEEIKFVFSVPAIWDETSIECMREVISEVGIDARHRMIVLEPEAVFGWCQNLHVGHVHTADTADKYIRLTETGTQCMIADLQDWIANFAVVEIKSDGALQLLHTDTNLGMGEETVDQKFFSLLTKLFGANVWEEIRKEHPVEMEDFIKEWSAKKRAHGTTNNVTIKLPVSLRKLCDLQDAIKMSNNSHHLKLISDKLRIGSELINSLFEDAIGDIVTRMKYILKRPELQRVSVVILQGTIAEGHLVQDIAEKSLPEKTFIVPADTTLAVVKGAVALGHYPAKTILGPTFKFLAVAAIDIGTAYSGYAFSFNNNPYKITTASWNAESAELLSRKTPTCVLLKPNKELDSFGYDAENKYTELIEDDEHRDWYYFKHFKMLLHDNEGLGRQTILEDILGKSMSALTIFAHTISFMKRHIITALRKQIPDMEQGDVKFVITVPAIWDDTAKRFMREAAIQAGIDENKFRLALEPEAASIWCQYVPTEKMLDKESAQLAIAEPGTKYMIVDLGGGTADITVHQKNADGTLKELHAASGGPWGGTAVDKKYMDLLQNIFGKDVLDKFTKQETEDLVDLQRDFEVKKRAISPEQTRLVTFKVPASLKVLYEKSKRQDITKAISKSQYEGKIKWVGDKFRVDAQIAKQLFEHPMNELSKHLKGLFQDEQLKDVQLLFLVGGFSECQLIQSRLASDFPKKRIIIPDDSGIAILKGAVLFGHKPSTVRSRVARMSYGAEHEVPFNPKVHLLQYKFNAGYGDMCGSIFQKYVEKDAEIPQGHVIQKKYLPRSINQTEITYNLYTSNKTDPKYITDEGCRLLGTFTVPLARGQTKQEMEVETAMVFGDTEILFKVKQMKTGKEFMKYFEFV